MSEHSTIATSELSSSATAGGNRAATALKPLSLRRNFSWTFAGNIVHAGCQWGMLMVLARLGSAEMLGQFVLGMAVVAPVMALFMLQLRAAQATDAKREYAFGDYMGLRVVTTTFAVVAITGLAFASGYSRETTLVILATGASAAVISIADVIYGLLQQREHMDRIARSLMLKGVLSIVGMAGAVAVTGSVFWGIVAVAAFRALVVISYDLPNAAWALRDFASASPKTVRSNENLRPRWDVRVLGNLTWLSLPLGVTMLLLSLKSNIPKYFVEHHLGIGQLGVFGAMTYLMLVGTTVVGALGQSAVPRLAQYYAAGKTKSFINLLLKLLVIGAVLGVAGVALAVVAGREILTVLYGGEYAEYAGVLVWVLAAAGVLYVSSFMGYAMTAARYFRVQVLIFGAAACTTALVCWLLLPNGGLHGAAIAILVGALVQLAGSTLVVHHSLHTVPTKTCM